MGSILYLHIEDFNDPLYLWVSTSPADEPRLPDFSSDNLQVNANMKAKCSEDARPKVDSLMRRIRALIAHGLGGMDLVLYWMTWRIHPLSPRKSQDRPWPSGRRRERALTARRPHPSPPPPYIGGRARVRARGRPALACPPSWSPTRTPPWAPFLKGGGPKEES